jgi:hypothetical protein
VAPLLVAAPAAAQPRRGDKAAPAPADKAAGDKPILTDRGDKGPGNSKDKPGKEPKEPKTFDFTGIDLNGNNRSPQLLYFLERANEELERASLERRSFIPHMVRSLDEEAL